MEGDATRLIEEQCPRLSTEGYEVTSRPSATYNCVAWAFGEDDRWWEPIPQYYWPDNVPRGDSLENYVRVFESAGYARCESAGYEPGYEKIAVYVDEDGAFAHAARQLEGGRWTSKMSWFEDIEHSAADSLLGGALIRVAAVLRRALPVA